MKNLLTLCLAVVFLTGATAQLLPCGMADSDMVIRADMADGCTGPQAPCAGYMPTCIDHIGRLTLPALPAAPAFPPIAFRWISIAYDLATGSLPGLSVEPELSPPILAA